MKSIKGKFIYPWGYSAEIGSATSSKWRNLLTTQHTINVSIFWSGCSIPHSFQKISPHLCEVDILPGSITLILDTPNWTNGRQLTRNLSK